MAEVKETKKTTSKKATTKTVAEKTTTKKPATKTATKKETVKKVEEKPATTKKVVEKKETVKKAPAKVEANKTEVAEVKTNKKASKAANKTLRVTLVKSCIGFPKDQRKIVVALGLNKLNSSNELVDNACVRGMIFKVKHLVRVEEIK